MPMRIPFCNKEAAPGGAPMYLARFSYDLLPVDRDRAMGFIRREPCRCLARAGPAVPPRASHVPGDLLGDGEALRPPLRFHDALAGPAGPGVPRRRRPASLRRKPPCSAAPRGANSRARAEDGGSQRSPALTAAKAAAPGQSASSPRRFSGTRTVRSPAWMSDGSGST